MSNRKGFALVEVLVAILTVCICIPIIVSVISLMRTSLKDRAFLQDQIALIQLRRYLAVAYEIELLPSSLTFQRNEIKCCESKPHCTTRYTDFFDGY
ncbi:MAG: type II secretion system protein [Solobacterium sp.]|nr:type II secretion system protein [Solobacterium sp.]